MRSYFIRYTEKLLIQNEDLVNLWREDRIAIHYPDKSSGREREDSRSLDPDDYKNGDKTAVARLVELATDGGYVWTESFISEGKVAKVGCVEPQTDVELCDATWDLRGRSDVLGRKSSDPAVLKTVKLSKAKIVSRREQVGLRAGRPRQGTIAHWSVGDRLADFVEDRPSARVWDNPSTAQQEATCAEFLRESHQARQDLPRMLRLLLPAGRTLQDIDLHGITQDGREIFGQVTYHPRNSAAARKKLEVLIPYGLNGAQMVFFCPGSGAAEEDGVCFVSADGEVLPWINENEKYSAALFPS